MTRKALKLQSTFVGRLVREGRKSISLNCRLNLAPPLVELVGYGALGDFRSAFGGLAGRLRGRLHTGEEVDIPEALGNVTVRMDGATESAFVFRELHVIPRPRRWPSGGYTGWVRREWLLTGSGILVDHAKKYLLLDGHHIKAMLADRTAFEAYQKARKAEINPMSWDTGLGLKGEFVVNEASEHAAEHPMGHSVHPTIYQPTAVASVWVERGTKARVEQAVVLLDRVIEAAVSVVSFVEARPIDWISKVTSLGDGGAARWVTQTTYPGFLRSDYHRRTTSRSHFGPAIAPHFVRAVAAHLAAPEYLESAVSSYIKALSEPLISRFILLSTALETMKALFQHETGSDTILTKSQFKSSVDKPLSKALKAVASSEEVYAAMRPKLAELNRYSYADSLRRMAVTWGVDLVGILDAKGNFGFISVRNDLVHTGQVSDWSLVVQEGDRLRALVERTIASRLQFHFHPTWRFAEL